MAIRGKYVDRRKVVVSSHACTRYLERCRLVADPVDAVREAWRNADLLLTWQPWWQPGVVSYWACPHARAVLIVVNEDYHLVIKTCLRLDSTQQITGSRKANEALARYRQRFGMTEAA